MPTQVPSEDLGVVIDYSNAGDVSPAHVIILPREGKDVILETHFGDRKTERGYKWDGMRFKCFVRERHAEKNYLVF